MNSKSITRNKKRLPINFCTTGNFINLNKIKFIPIYNSLKMNKDSIGSKKNSFSNLSETISNSDKSKDELIKKLKDRISFLENRIKILEKEMDKVSKRSLLSKTLTSKNNNTSKKLYQRKITTIPLDKNLLKSKLNKNKKKFLELLEVNKVIKRNRSKSFHNKRNNLLKCYRSKCHSTINSSNSNWNTANNSCNNSGYKPKKKNPKLINKTNSIKFLHNLLSYVSKTEKGQNSFSNIQKKKRNFCGLENKNISIIERKINAIPKKGRKNFNLSPKMMMSSTNYSNNISSSFKDDANLKKNSPSKKLTNNNSFFEKHSFHEVKLKLDNIHKRTKNLLEFYSNISLDKKDITQLKNNINEDKIIANYYHYIKISKFEKHKKE